MTDDRTCSRTPQVMADHLGCRPGSTAGREAARHIAGCPDCQAELAELEPVTARLRQWREQRVPDWNRRPQGRTAFWRRRWLRWQWAPLAASVVLALAVVLNVQVGVNEAGWQISFGDGSAPAGGGMGAPGDTRPLTGDRVQRPDGEAMRPSMALSLESGPPVFPDQVDPSQWERRDDEGTVFEQQLYAVLCRSGAVVGVPDGEYLTVVLSGLGDAPMADGQPGNRIHRIDGAALQACQRGDIGAAALMEESGRYRF